MNLEKILQQAEIKVIQYPNKALILVKDNLDAIKKQDNLDMLVTAYYIIASANARLDKYNDAITYIKKCLKLIYQDDIQNNIRIEAHILLAWSLISIENKEDAIKEIYIALKIATAEKNYHQLYRSLIVKALIHERCGQHYAALQAYKKAKHTNAEYPTVISRTNLAVSSLNIANIFNYLENYDIAIDYYNEALRYLETEDAPMQKLYLKYNNVLFNLENNLT